MALPTTLKADLKLGTVYGDLYVDPDFKIEMDRTDKDGMVIYNTNINGKINGGGGVGINLSSTHNNVYLRKAEVNKRVRRRMILVRCFSKLTRDHDEYLFYYSWRPWYAQWYTRHKPRSTRRPYQPGQKIAMNFDYPEMIRVSAWDKNEISISGSVQINGGENDDALSASHCDCGQYRNGEKARSRI